MFDFLSQFQFRHRHLFFLWLVGAPVTSLVFAFVVAWLEPALKKDTIELWPLLIFGQWFICLLPFCVSMALMDARENGDLKTARWIALGFGILLSLSWAGVVWAIIRAGRTSLEELVQMGVFVLPSSMWSFALLAWAVLARPSR